MFNVIIYFIKCIIRKVFLIINLKTMTTEITKVTEAAEAKGLIETPEVTTSMNESKQSAWKLVEDKLSIAQNFLEQYPELLYLGIEWVQNTAALNTNSDSSSLAEHLCPWVDPSKLVELNKTLTTLVLQRLVEENKIEEFIGSNDDHHIEFLRPNPERVSELFKRIQDSLSGCKHSLSLSTTLAIHDAWKSPKVQQLISDPLEFDHEEILIKAINEAPNQFPSIWKLDENGKNLLLKLLGCQFQILQFNQLENTSASLESILELSDEEFELKMSEAALDLAWAAGAVTQSEAKTMITPVLEWFLSTWDILREIRQRGLNANDGYDLKLNDQATKYGFDISIPNQRAMTRIASMLRLTKSDDAQALLNAYEALPTEQIDTITKELNTSWLEWKKSIKLEFLPDLLLNTQSRTKSLSGTIEEVMPSIYSLVANWREYLNSSNKWDTNGEFTIWIRQLAILAKTQKMSEYTPIRKHTQNNYAWVDIKKK